MKKKASITDKNFFLSPFVYFILILSIVLYGLVIMYSASYYEALIHNLDHYYFLKRQVIFVVLALAVSIVIHFIDFKLIEAVTYPLVILSIILMLLTLFTSFGVTILGARRWLEIGPIPSFQPSEFVKVSTVLFLAKYYKNENKRDIIPILLVLVNAALILLQKDYSTTIVYLITSFALLLICGCELKIISLIALFLFLPAGLALFSQGYRIKRIISFVFPSLDPTGLNYQINNSIDAIASGGLFGKSIGNGYYKMGILPEVQNDFIFAHLGEETGFIGIFILILFFLVFTHIGYKVARENYDKNKLFSYISFGITTQIVLQAIINMMVVTALLPPTGIPLPFFSQGGTNLFFTIILVSIVHKIIFETSIYEENIPKDIESDENKVKYVTDYEEFNFD
ncbi:MAG: putative peptidoglycan glycosyltransferase FtsW [Sphaerochaetaceae bacterium]|nr:putative peptidoglycan glycosyltransferase FtsW [Sphaerochaetaceae bacterium]